MKRRTLITGTVAATTALKMSGNSLAETNEEFKSMVNVIPAPHHVKRSDEGSVVVDHNAWITAETGTERARAWLVDGLQRFAGNQNSTEY